MLNLPQGMAITAEIKPGYETILTREALELVADAASHASSRAASSCSRRAPRARSASTRASAPTSSPRRKRSAKATGPSRRCRAGLECRRVEITGPVERKMIINALNSGADALHDRLRGFEHAELGQPDDRPHQPEGRGARHDFARAERQDATG